MTALSILTILSSIVGGFVLLLSIGSPSAPGQAALAATACALAVIPYVLCRAVQLIVEKKAAARRHAELLRALAERSAAATRHD